VIFTVEETVTGDPSQGSRIVSIKIDLGIVSFLEAAASMVLAIRSHRSAREPASSPAAAEPKAPEARSRVNADDAIMLQSLWRAALDHLSSPPEKCRLCSAIATRDLSSSMDATSDPRCDACLGSEAERGRASLFHSSLTRLGLRVKDAAGAADRLRR